MRKTGWKKIIALALLVALCMGSSAWLACLPKTQASWTPVRLPDRQIILDAGHGGEDGGAVSVTGIPESQINLAVTLKLDQLLGFCGLAPILTRDSDVSVYDPGCNTLREKKVSDIHNRVALIEGTDNALVVSIHQNTFPNAAYHGAQVFFRPGEESEALAKQVQQALCGEVDPGNKRTPTRIPSSVYLMAHITCPAVLVECGFLSNPAEEKRLRSSCYQNKLAMCLTSALLQSGEIQGSETPGPVV